MSNKKFTYMDFCRMLARIKEIKGVKYDQNVAKLLGLSKTALAERKRRNSVPLDKLAIFCERESINMNWLLTGKGSREKEARRTKKTKYPATESRKMDAESERQLGKIFSKIRHLFYKGEEPKLSAIKLILNLGDSDIEK